MQLFWIFVVATLGIVLADDICPPAKVISPCTCDGEGFNCMLAKNIDDIRRAFKANFKYGGVRSVWIQGLTITNIPSDLFGSIKSQQFYIEMNSVTSVDINAFSASKKTLQVLSLFGNQLSTFPFQGVSSFERLGTLNLGKNQITSIPANAFDSRTLYTLILTQNKITSIGMNAFANLPNLGRLEIAYNSLSVLGPMSFAMKLHSAGLQINLGANQISSVSSSAFTGAEPYVIIFAQNRLTSLNQDPFANLITRIAQKGGFIEVSANPFTCRGCDYSWLALNKEILYSRLIGFTCNDGRGLDSLTRANIGC